MPPSQATLEFTPVEEIDQIYTAVRAGFASHKLHSVQYRKEQISQLGRLLDDNAEAFRLALEADLGRPAFETNMLEFMPTLQEVRVTYNNVAKWAKTEYAPPSLVYGAMRPAVRKDPKGVVLIISPFNFPIFLTFGPLCGAIAAGCPAVIKPSELSPSVSKLFADLFPKYMDPDLFRIVNGAKDQNSKLLELKWDHIMYTGGERVAKIVAAAAAKTLTPVTLELGGKSPVVIDPKCNIESAAHKILWGKMSNTGQTCVAPDYVLVPKSVQAELVAALEKVHTEYYPTGARESQSFGRIVSPGHFDRIKGLIDRSNGTVVFGGSKQCDVEAKFIPPTVVSDVTGEDSLMSEELFGPVLPLVPVEDVDEAIKFINAREHPLALYVFSQDSAFKQKVTENTQSGSIIANEVIIHLGVSDLPLGGVGASGYGQYTGKFGFDTFTHFRGTMDSPTWLDLVLHNRYPPYTKEKGMIIDVMTKQTLPPRVGESMLERWKTLAAGTVMAVGSLIAARKAMF